MCIAITVTESHEVRNVTCLIWGMITSFGLFFPQLIHSGCVVATGTGVVVVFRYLGEFCNHV